MTIDEILNEFEEKSKNPKKTMVPLYDPSGHYISEIEVPIWPKLMRKIVFAMRESIKGLKFYASEHHIDGDDYTVETCDQSDFDLHEYNHGEIAKQTLVSISEILRQK